MSLVSAAVDFVAGTVAVLIPLIATLITLRNGRIQQRRQAFDDQMLRAFDLMTGGSQKRSAGIAILEGRVSLLQRDDSRSNDWRLAAIGHLRNQIVYLRDVSDHRDRADEVQNLERLEELLSKLDLHASS
jgi:hypothetical protein